MESKSFSELQRLVLDYTLLLCRSMEVPHQNANYIIRKAIKFIQKNYQQAISLQSIAESIYVNPSYLSRLFKKETGITITEEILKHKMEKAKEFLQNSNCLIKEVANKVGYEDVSYFSKSFKDYTGVSPKAYKTSGFS